MRMGDSVEFSHKSCEFLKIGLEVYALCITDVMKKGITLLFLAGAFSLQAGDLDTIGVTVLRQVDPTLTGSGVKVAQPEAPYTNPNEFEVNPASVGQPVSLFTYISTNGGIVTGYPNSAGVESGHADTVGGNFYGIDHGVATNVSHVDNYAVDNYFNHYIYHGLPLVNPARVVNQSFIFDPADELVANTNYDDYAAQYGTIFVSGIAGANNVEPICAPGTCYNGIGVGAYGVFYLPGPTTDGRCKPDITAPDQAQVPGAVSYATAYVSGSAAILIQAANRGDGGANTNAADDLRTVKALLLNGAIKPGGWTNGEATPLDARYGAGLVNIFNSWKQLKGGKNAFIESTTSSSGGAHPPGPNTNNEPTLAGWDYNSISTTPTQDRVNHYYFNLSGGYVFALTATLVWNKQDGAANINNLNLFLYNTANSNLVMCSTSMVDNVEHVYLPALAAGRYDLQVLKKGSANQISTAETYALAFEMFTMQLSARLTNGNVVISWPVAPTGFQLQSAASLNPPVSWTAVPDTVLVTNSQNVVTLSAGVGNQYFRLYRPAF